MKRELKKKIESPKDFTARNIISSLDKQIEELNKNNLEIDTIVSLIRNKTLSKKQEENVKKALNTALELSSNMLNSFKEEF
jgi:hypothetical protein